MDYKIIEWDSNFFGFLVARLDSPHLTTARLKTDIFALKRDGVKLVYWPAERTVDIEWQNNFQGINGLLVDRKTTFVKDLATSSRVEISPVAMVESYGPDMAVADLENLAIQSGKYSRFSVDPNIPKQKFHELYTIWIYKLLAKELADEVLVIRDRTKVVAMITCGNKNGRGKIGLYAVDKSYRHKKFGTALLMAAQHWFREHKFKYIEVVTQGVNISACRVYEKCGYSVEKVEYYYHFWLL